MIGHLQSYPTLSKNDRTRFLYCYSEEAELHYLHLGEAGRATPLSSFWRGKGEAVPSSSSWIGKDGAALSLSS